MRVCFTPPPPKRKNGRGKFLRLAARYQRYDKYPLGSFVLDAVANLKVGRRGGFWKKGDLEGMMRWVFMRQTTGDLVFRWVFIRVRWVGYMCVFFGARPKKYLCATKKPKKKVNCDFFFFWI